MESSYIKTYGRRQGKITKGQSRALAEDTLRCCSLDIPFPYFSGKDHVLEIGFGMGDSLVLQAAREPQTIFVGVEVYQAGVGSCLLQAQQLELENLYVYNDDIYEVGKVIPDSSLNVVQVFFPDPWPKKRHHKRRLLQDKFLDVLSPKLLPGAVLRIATDNVGYANEVHEFLAARSDWQILTGVEYNEQQRERIESKYARRAARLGHQIVDIIARYQQEKD